MGNGQTRRGITVGETSMTAKKLSDVNAQELIELYRRPEETAASVGQRYGVSSSTISRFLKSHLSESEYASLTQTKQKRPNRVTNPSLNLAMDSSKAVEPFFTNSLTSEIPETEEEESLQVLSSASSLPTESREDVSAPLSNSSEPIPANEFLDSEEDLIDENMSQEAQVGFITVGTMFEEDISDEEEEEDEEDDEEEDEEDSPEVASQLIGFTGVQVLPLSQASFPHVCYLVIDRASELITRPLKDFDHLGTIPPTEVLEKTLPVFDNHRVARRFSNRRGKVIKVPDGKMLRKTSSYLQSKGITRLLIDGQVYSLV